MLCCYPKKCLIAFALLLFCTAGRGYAMMHTTTLTQNRSAEGGITGTVLNQDAHPLKGVRITVKGQNISASTDAQGNFSIDAQPGSTLVFSCPNYNVREVKAAGSAPLNIRLLDTYLQAPDTVDVLYGTQKASSVLGAMSTVYTNQLTTTPASLYVYALPGQLTGLYTQQVSGFTSFNTAALYTPTFGLNIVNGTAQNNVTTDNYEVGLGVRGQNSSLLGGINNGPITVIDGVQREISSIDPESIESVSVLKDALSTILLGINSSRGVLLVTTKKAEAGKPRISFTAQGGLQHSLGLPSPLSAYQYAYLYNEASTNDGGIPIYSSADFNAYRNHTDPYGHPDVNWFKTILRNTSPISSYNLNINGGSKVARYSVSAGYFNQGGIFKEAPDATSNTNTNLSRYIINSDVNVQVNKNLNVDLQLFGRVQQTAEPGPGYTTILSRLYGTPNNAYPIYNPNGSFGGSNLGGNTGPYSNNLLAMTEYSGYISNNTDDILANLDLKYNLNGLLKGLSFKAKGNLSYQSQNSLNRSLQNASYLYRDSAYTALGSTVAQSNVFTTVFTSRQSYGQAALNYDRQFGKSGINALLMYDTKSVTTNFDLTAVTSNRALKVAYNYDEKYFIEGAVNNSGYNRYPPGHQFGTFYAGGIGWQMAREDFIKDNLDWISSWKWRATYGKTGNGNVDQFSYYGYAQTYSNSNYQYYYPTGTNRATQYTYYDNTIANPYITWERGNKLDIGTDIALFQNHLKITADYYHERYSNLLQVRGASVALLGTAFPYENIGINLYHGEEFTVTYQNNVHNFNYFITGNASIQASKVVYSDEEPSMYPYNRHTGLPTTTIFGYTAQGFFPTAADAAKGPTIAGYTAQAGDIKYKDLNGDGVINQFDLSPIGGLKPLIYYGLNFGFNYKGFNMSVLIQGVTNRQINVQNVTTVPFSGLGFLGSAPYGQAYQDATNRWTPETASTAQLPRLSFNNQAYGGNNSQTSSFYIKSGDYVRLKNAEIGYTLPYTLSRRLRVTGIKVFVNGENLVTLAGFKGMDPEVLPGSYPIQRVLNTGVSIKL